MKNLKVRGVTLSGSENREFEKKEKFEKFLLISCFLAFASIGYFLTYLLKF